VKCGVTARTRHVGQAVAQRHVLPVPVLRHLLGHLLRLVPPRRVHRDAQQGQLPRSQA